MSKSSLRYYLVNEYSSYIVLLIYYPFVKVFKIKVFKKSFINQFTMTNNPHFVFFFGSQSVLGWSGGAKVLGKLPVPGRPTIL